MSRKESGSAEIVSLLFVGLLIWGGFHLLHKKPPQAWWDGTSDEKVCLIGTGCYSLPVSSDNGQITQIDFPNGGYIVPQHGSVCQKDGTIGLFCSFTDAKGREWEVRQY